MRRASYSASIAVRSAARGRLPSRGRRSITCSKDRLSQIEAPSLLIAIRLAGSTNVPPPVATIVCRWGSSSCRTAVLDPTEVRLAVLAEDVGDGAPRARLDELVDVRDLPFEPRPECLGHGGFPGAHEANEIDLVRSHGC